MPTSDPFSMNGWYARASKTWYPTNQTLAAMNAYAGINHVASSPTRDGVTTSSNNKKAVAIQFTTPSTAGIGTITAINFTWYQAKVSTSSGTVYGIVMTGSPFGWSTVNDTLTTYTNQKVSGSSEGSVTTTSSGYTKAEMTITGSFTKNKTYYLLLYTKSTNHEYQISKSTKDYPISATVTYDYAKYKVSYANGGKGTAPAAQNKTHKTDLTLAAFISNQSENSHVINFNSNEGSSTPKSITSKKVYKQLKWKDGDGDTYDSKGTYSKDKATTMTATWDSGTQQSITLPEAISKDPSESKYTISYNANNPNTDSTTSTIPSNQSLTRTTTYSFKKWAVDSATSTTVYDAGVSFTPESKTTMFATWNTEATTGSIDLASAMTKGDTTAAGYKVTFNAHGGICDKEYLTANNIIQWKFNGWNTAANGSGTSYAAESSYNKDSGATMYAQWTDSIKTYGSIVLPTPTKTGYKFNGWAESVDASSGITGSYQPKESLTLHAIWEPDGGVRIYLKEYKEYKIALVYICIDGVWKLTIPYIYDKNSSSWKILGG